MHHQHGIAALGPSTMLLEVLGLAGASRLWIFPDGEQGCLRVLFRRHSASLVGKTPRALRPCAGVEPRVPCMANDNLRLAKATLWLCSLLCPLWNKLLAPFLPVPECTSPQTRPPCKEKDLCGLHIRQYQAVEPHPQIRHMPYHGHRVDSTLANSWARPR